MDFSKLDRYLVESALDQPDACKVIVDYSMEPNTMRIPPDVFARIMEFSAEYERENCFWEQWRNA